MGAEKIVNRTAKRPLLNGAAWYLPAVACWIVIEIIQFSSIKLPEDPVVQAEMMARMTGAIIGGFFLPVGAAVYYALKFTRAQQPTANGSQSPNS
jgi:hypothetical protein